MGSSTAAREGIHRPPLTTSGAALLRPQYWEHCNYARSQPWDPPHTLPQSLQSWRCTCGLQHLEWHLPMPHSQPVTKITQPCVHTCDGWFICQLYLLPDLLEEMDCKEDTPLTLPFALFVSLSQLIIVIWIKTSVGITTVFHTGISGAVAAA
jgi:hypothetical protein